MICFLFDRMAIAAVWILVASAVNPHKQKTTTSTSTAANKNSTLTRDFYLTQQHILQHTR